MRYRYNVLESALVSIAREGTTENIFDQVSRLTSDERRILRELMTVAEDACYSVEIDQGEIAA